MHMPVITPGAPVPCHPTQDGPSPAHAPFPLRPCAGTDGSPAHATLTHPVHDRDGVQEAEHEEERPAVHKAREQDVAHPQLALHLSVVRRRNITRNRCREGVHHDQYGVQRAAVIRVEHADERKREDKEGQVENLRARADECAEQVDVRREAKHVAMHVLPAGLVFVQRSCG
eukprot:195538-Chlamydomonas_euryale.AAC.1